MRTCVLVSDEVCGGRGKDSSGITSANDTGVRTKQSCAGRGLRSDTEASLDGSSGTCIAHCYICRRLDEERGRATVLPGVDSASADIIDRPRTKCVVGEVVSTGS